MSSENKNPGDAVDLAQTTAIRHEALEEEAAANQIGFPVVGVGASAGGLEAFREFLDALPEDPGCAFVFIQHLSPNHESLMADILDKLTPLSVVEATDDTTIETNCVYVIPPDRYIRLEDGAIVLDRPVEQKGLRLPIDYFFRSLAEIQRERAIAVVLTGTGSDGSEGVREVKAAGGLVIVQDADEARYDGMPRSAIKTKSVDFVEPIAKIPSRIIQFIRHPYIDRSPHTDEIKPLEELDVTGIVALLKARTKFDFSPYKQGTLHRRVQRRMGLHQIKDVNQYLDKLRDDAAEINFLCKDLLITVTRFFRDHDVWSRLNEEIQKIVAAAAREDREVRIWAPGCATGEEAYSLAILAQDAADKLDQNVQYQIFATDLEEDAIAGARNGVYPKNIEQDVPQDYLSRFFQKEETSYRVAKRIRENVVFAPHNLISDPPFSGLDLVSCRNLLIYISPETQSRVLDVFHFALRPEGVLLLGSSESLGRNAPFFSAISQEHRIYRRAPVNRAERGVYPYSARREEKKSGATERNEGHLPSERMADAARRILMSRYAPATVLVNGEGDARYFHGPVHRFLELPDGEPTFNVSDMAGSGLKLRLRNAMRQARQTDQRVATEALRVQRDNEMIDIRVDVEPVRDGRVSEPLYLVSFVEVDRSEADREGESEGALRDRADDGSADLVRQLESELQSTREDLQTTIEELETTNEELKASNEEAMSTNEELQSTNEELETSREELQSLNEELVTVNAQLEDKVDELEGANNDLANLLSSVEIAVLFLDRELRIQRFTEPATAIFSIIDSDIGRPVADLNAKIDDPSFMDDAKQVLRNLNPKSAEVKDREENRWFQRQLRPYRTSDDRIEGLVVTFTEITALKNNLVRLERAEKQQRIVAELGRRALSINSIERFFKVACDSLAREFAYDCTKVMRFHRETEDFSLVAGFGWREGLVGTARVPSEMHSQAGYTALQRGPVIVEDFNTEERFERPLLLADHGIESGISCLIGRDDDVWGVIGIHCKKPRQFSDEDGAFVQAIANLLYDSILRISREEALAEAEETLRLTLDAADMGVWRWEIDKDVVIWDDNVRRIFDVDKDEQLNYAAFLDHVHPDDRQTVMDAVSAALDEDESYQTDYRVVQPSGDIVSVVARGDIICAEGEKRVLLGVIYDVTRQKTLERQYELIARELDHRVKNLLATVVSMARMMNTDALSIEDFKAVFQARMESLANTHGLLAQSKWRGATIDELLDLELEPYRRFDRENIKKRGPAVTLEPHAAQCLSMAFHELATNAAKYGALSVETGTIAVKWDFSVTDDKTYLDIEWSERGGPKIAKPTSEGFGTKVLNSLLAHQLSADVELSYEAAGFRGVFRLPAEENISGSSRDSIKFAQQAGPGLVRAAATDNLLEGLTILVVDDEWFVSAALAEALQRAGADVPKPAASIEQALALVDEYEADFAVLDYNIAGQPVIPVIQRLAENDVPMMIVSGYGSRLKLPEEFSDIAVFSKPVSEDRLISEIAERMRRNENDGAA